MKQSQPFCNCTTFLIHYNIHMDHLCHSNFCCIYILLQCPKYNNVCNITTTIINTSFTLWYRMTCIYCLYNFERLTNELETFVFLHINLSSNFWAQYNILFISRGSTIYKLLETLQISMNSLYVINTHWNIVFASLNLQSNQFPN